jgi:hypothetical protein
LDFCCSFHGKLCPEALCGADDLLFVGIRQVRATEVAGFVWTDFRA